MLGCGLDECLADIPHSHCQFVAKLVPICAAEPIRYCACNKLTRKVGDRYCWHHSRH